eukprot:Sspe_Gene.14834::Locus_5142_Transcript_1_1_Confidence_1.000_Length_1052::g.14834::m.14834/K00344/qor, CRYZ; NADPH2:quinone reductase
MKRTMLNTTQRRYRTIRAAVCKKLGDPLRVVDYQLDDKIPTGHVRLKVAAAGVNFAEILQIKGKYQEKADPPFVPGNECAGVVDAVGDEVDGLKQGDPVICINRGGGYATEIVAPSTSIIPIRNAPRDVNLHEAAALLISYGTAHLALTRRAALRKGETVLVTAAAGGVGLAAVQIAKLHGARVIAACGSEKKVGVAMEHGADVGIVYGDDPAEFKEQVKRAAGPNGVDIMVDMVGGIVLETGIRGLAWEGRAVVVGFAQSTIPKIPANILLVKNIGVLGMYWGSYMKHDPATHKESCDAVIKAWTEGSITPHISYSYPLDEVAKAHEAITSRE